MKPVLNDNRHLMKYFLIFVLLSFLVVGLTWANYQYALRSPGGNDFLVHWHGARALILDGISPYSDEVATRIQVDAYGKPAEAGEHELRVAYPIYSVIMFAPFALIRDYTVARALWMTVLEVGLILLAIVSLRITGWKPGLGSLLVYLLFTVVWYHAIRPVILGNAVILITLMIASALLAIKHKRDGLSGVLLAFATIKPQLVVLFIPLIFLWAASSKRWKIIIWTLGSLFVLAILGMIFVPDWFLQNMAEVIRYPGYNPPGTPGAAFSEWFQHTGKYLGLALTLLLVLFLLKEWYGVLRKDFYWLIWVACLTLVASQWIGIQTDPGNFIILYLPFVYVFVNLDLKWDLKSNILSIALMLVVLIGLWILFLLTVETGPQPQQHAIMFFPLPLVIFLGLYLIRNHVLTPQPVS